VKPRAACTRRDQLLGGRPSFGEKLALLRDCRLYPRFAAEFRQAFLGADRSVARAAVGGQQGVRRKGLEAARERRGIS